MLGRCRAVDRAGVLLCALMRVAPGPVATPGHHLVAHAGRLPPVLPSDTSLTWLRVNPRFPRIVYIGGSFDCPRQNGMFGYPCSDWALRSPDGGQS